jgi:glycosyltransferase involved in cell wall biosynthesis
VRGRDSGGKVPAVAQALGMGPSGGRRPTPYRLAVTATHPVQYQAPLWRELVHSGVHLRVFYGSTYLSEQGCDPGFGVKFAWDVPLLGGYPYEVLDSRPFPRIMGRLRERWGPGDRFPVGLTKRLREGAFEAVLVHGYVSGTALGAMHAARKTATPIILRGDSHSHGREASPKRKLWRSMLRLFLRRVSFCLAVGTWNREFWLELGVPSDRIVTSLFAVDADYFRRQLTLFPSRARELRQSWGAREADVVFLFSGRLVPIKAPGLLLRALSLVSPRSGGHVVIVGSGPLEGELRRMRAELSLDRVHFTGFVNQSEIAHYYAAADVLVMPSTHEPWGLSVNEAQACGCGCIVSDTVGCGPDLIAAFRAGVVFPRDSPSALARCLELAFDREERETWRTGAETAAKAASFQDNVRAISTTLEMLRSGPRGRHGGRAVVAREREQSGR